MPRHTPLVSASCPNLADVRNVPSSASRRAFDEVPPARPDLGSAVRMSPQAWRDVQRAISASRPQRPKTAGDLNGHGHPEPSPEPIILEPLPPPRERPAPMDPEEEEELHRDAKMKLLEARLKLMEEGDRSVSPVSAPAGSLPEVSARRKLGRLVAGPRLRRISPGRRRRASPYADDTRVHQAYTGEWGELNPFDPVQNPRAHLLLQQRRAMSESPERQHRSVSAQRDLESFRPSFRTEWLVALRRELLLGVRQECAKNRRDFNKTMADAVTELKESYEAAVTAIRKDYADAAADIRHDFIDCFINGDISGMIEAANKKKRLVDVDFHPVFEEIDSIKKHVNSSESEVLDAIRAVRKEQTNLRDETSRLVVDLTDSVSNDIQKVSGQVEQALGSVVDDIRSSTGEVDFSPVLDAIQQIEDVDLTPMFNALNAARDSEIKIQADLGRLSNDVVDLGETIKLSLNAIQDNEQLELTDLDGIKEEIGQMIVRSEADSLILLNAIAGSGLDVGQQLGALDEQLLRVKEDIRQAGATSQDAVSNQSSMLGKIQDRVSSTSQQILQAVQEAGEKQANVDFSPIIEACLTSNLAPVIESIDTSREETCESIRSNSKEILQGIKGLDFKKDFALAVKPVLESVSKVTDIATQIDSKQGLMQTTLTDTQTVANQIATIIPPPTDLAPVLEAIGQIDVQPEVKVDLQSVLDAVDDVGEITRTEAKKLLTAVEAEDEDVKQLSLDIATMSSKADSDARRFMEKLGTISKIKDDLEEMKSEIHRVSDESVLKVCKATDVALEELCSRLTGRGSEEAQAMLAAIEEIQARSQTWLTANLDPVLDAIASVDFSSISSSIDSSCTATLEAIQEASADIRSSSEQASSKLDEMLAHGFDSLHRLDEESKIVQKALLELVMKIDGKDHTELVDQIAGLHELAARIDGKDHSEEMEKIGAVLDAVSAIEINPVVKVDTRPVIDCMSAGLARIEIAWAQVDLTELTDFVKKIHSRLLETMVKLDKDQTKPNFNWVTEGNKWT